MMKLDERVGALLAAGETVAATTLVLRELGPELLGFLSGVLGDADADEVFSALSERLWRSLSGFEGRCSIRTWSYVLARHELGRFRRDERRRVDGWVAISDLKDILAAARSRTRSMTTTDKQHQLSALRDALPVEDRTLLILRVDRKLSWDEIAVIFADTSTTLSEVERKREAARLRKRFQLIKQRLVARIREALAT